MKPTLAWALGVGGTVGLLVLVLVSLKIQHRREAPRPAPLAQVQLSLAQPVMVSPRDEVTGTLEPSKRVQLGFEVTGRLARVVAHKGQRVQEGDLLAELATDLVDAQLQQADAALQGAFSQAETARDVAQRTEKLKAGGAVSEQQGLAVTSNARNAEAQVALARAQVAELRARRARHSLRAPFAGVVVEAPDQPGAIVSSLTTPLFTLEQLDPLTLHLTVAETARAALAPGTRVHVSAVSSAASTDEATVWVILPSADGATRRVPVELQVPNTDSRFTAHTLVRAELSLGAAQVATQLPATALASAGGDHVFVVDADGIVARVPVQVLDRGPTSVVVRAERPLTQVVDSPSVDLVEGAHVQATSTPPVAGTTRGH